MFSQSIFNYFFYLLVIICAYSLSAKPIIVASEHYPGYTNLDGSGLYMEILAEVYPDNEIKLIITSYERAVKMVATQQADLWLGAYKNERPNAIYPQYHFDNDLIAVAFHIQNNQWHNQKSFLNKRIAWVKGYEFEQFVKTKYTLYTTPDLTTALKMLNKFRVDYVIDDWVELKNNAQFNSLFSVSIFAKKPLYPAFSNNFQGQQLANLWDSGIERIIINGKLEALFATDEFSQYPYP